MAKEPLLNLSTLTEREHILIDGKRYEIRNRGELGILDLKAFSGYAKSISKLVQNGDGFSDNDINELERLTVAAIKRIVCGISDAVINQLGIPARTAIIEVFTDRLPLKAGTTGVKGKRKTPQTRIGAG